MMLPSDRYIAQTLGLTEDEYALFQDEVRRRAAVGPQPSVVAGIIDPFTWAIIAIVSSLISVGLTIAASFFKPSTDEKTPAQLKVRDKVRNSVADNQRFAPRYGFDAAQDVAEAGSIIPLIYCAREQLGGDYYGGCRVNALLLWSKIESYGGNQLLRAIFMLGEGPIASIDTNSLAVGSNTLGGYDFANGTDGTIGTRLTLYGRLRGDLTQRLKEGNYLLGRWYSTDPGNSQRFGAADVFQIVTASGYKPAFCASSKPSTQTAFGVYTLIGNNLDWRVNPVIRPKVQAQLVPEGDDGDAKVKCRIDDVASSQRKKSRGRWSTRSGITLSQAGTLNGQIQYVIHNSSDVETTFSRAISIQSWEIDKTQVSGPGTGNLNKPKNKKWIFQADNRKKSTDFTNRVSVSVTSSGINTTSNAFDINGKNIKPGFGWLQAAITFNTNGLGEDGDEPDPDLEALKNIKFRIDLTNKVLDNEDDKEERIRYVFKPRFKQRTTQSFIFDGGRPSSSSTSTDEDGNETVNFYPGSAAQFDTLDEINAPEWDPESTNVNVTLPFDAGNIHVEPCTDIASAVTGRQKVLDDALVFGELYKAGSALVVLTERSDTAFVSDSDSFPVVVGSGTPTYANFTVVRPGTCTAVDPNAIAADSKGSGYARYTATNWTHLYRIAIANITTTRACSVIEIGFRSTLGIRISGLCNFRSAISYEDSDERACLSRENDTIEEGNTLKVDNYQSGQMSSNEERYSFFRLYYRAAGSNAGFTASAHCYGFRGSTQQAQMNAITLIMPSAKQWEIRIEPLTGWEIRSGAAGGNLHVLDGRLSEVSVGDGALTVRFRGQQGLVRTSVTFMLSSTRTNKDLGIPNVDGSSYVDAWGKLAEAFVYEEVSSTAQSPEHEIVYVNEAVENVTTPNYDGLAILGLNVRSSSEWQQFSQLSVYCTGGLECRRLQSGSSIGPTHLFPNILLDLLTNTTYGRGDVVTDDMIDLASFTDAATYCNTQRYFYDGVISSLTSVRQWAANTAAAHLLIFGESGGRFFLRRAIPSGPVTIAAMFTAGNIQEGSFRLQFLDPEEREPISVAVKYREERASTDLANPGLFPIERSILVKENDYTAASDMVESLDLADFCTNQTHAVHAARYVIRMRRLSDHVISFATTYEGVLSAIAPSDYIRVAMDTTHYDQFSNGGVTASGALVSTKPLADGTYNVILWNGTAADPPEDGTLTVSGGGTMATPTGIVFTVKSEVTQVRTYQIESIRPSEDGTFQIEAVHTPTTATGELELAAGFFDDGNWTNEV